MCYAFSVDETQKRKPMFWQILFATAFGLGAILWCIWMWHIVQKTREERDSGFFVPVTGQNEPAPSSPPPVSSNAPSSQTNSASSNGK